MTAGMGFHEFLVIDRTNRSGRVVVSSDDWAAGLHTLICKRAEN